MKIVIWGTGIAALGLRWGPQWSDLVDMPISDRYKIGCSQKKGQQGHFWDEVPDISNENRDAVENDVFRVNVWVF